MKRYETVNPDMIQSVYYVGETEEIQRVYRAIRKAGIKGSHNWMQAFPGNPIFNPNKAVYAIRIESNCLVSVVNSDTMLSLIVSGDVKEM